jgi:hypothetical protein
MDIAVKVMNALIKKKRKFSSYIRKFKGIGCKVQRLTTSSYMVIIFVHFLIYSIMKPFLIYAFAPYPI